MQEHVGGFSLRQVLLHISHQLLVMLLVREYGRHANTHLLHEVGAVLHAVGLANEVGELPVGPVHILRHLNEHFAADLLLVSRQQHPVLALHAEEHLRSELAHRLHALVLHLRLGFRLNLSSSLSLGLRLDILVRFWCLTLALRQLNLHIGVELLKLVFVLLSQRLQLGLICRGDRLPGLGQLLAVDALVLVGGVRGQQPVSLGDGDLVTHQRGQLLDQAKSLLRLLLELQHVHILGHLANIAVEGQLWRLAHIQDASSRQEVHVPDVLREPRAISVPTVLALSFFVPVPGPPI